MTWAKGIHIATLHFCCYLLSCVFVWNRSKWYMQTKWKIQSYLSRHYIHAWTLPLHFWAERKKYLVYFEHLEKNFLLLLALSVAHWQSSSIKNTQGHGFLFKFVRTLSAQPTSLYESCFYDENPTSNLLSPTVSWNRKSSWVGWKGGLLRQAEVLF